MHPPTLETLVATALAEDLGELGDATSNALVPADAIGRGRFVARAPGVLAGTEAATEVFRQVDAAAAIEWTEADGAVLAPGAVIGRCEGPARSLLTAERTALNLLGHLSGIATLTQRYVAAAGPHVTILDTRKTLPGLRALEKAAVAAGGGANHRMGLYDAILVKDNHLTHVTIADAVARARLAHPDLMVEIECDTLAQVEEAVDAGADRVLLDNMTPAQVASAVRSLRDHPGRRTEVEVSGGVTLDNVAEYAAAEPDFISIGALTHSAPSLDLALDFDHAAGGRS